MIGTLFILLLSAWCAIVKSESSNDLSGTIREFQHEMASMKITLAEQKEIIENQNFNIEKQNGILDKLKKGEQRLKSEIEYLHTDLHKMKKNIEACCPSLVGKSKESPAQSCKWLRENADNVTSGLFWVSLKTSTKVYCDMNKANDGGGWTMIGQAEAQTDLQGKQIQYQNIMSNNIEDLSNVVTRRYLLSGKGLRELQTYINFTQIRFYCHKPWHGRTLHIYTSKNDLGESVVDLMTGKSNVLPKSCDSYKRMNDDSSNIGAHCESWWDQKWYGWGDVNERMYNLPMAIDSGHKYLCGDRIECDDWSNSGDPGFNKIGKWAYYVR